MRAVKLKSYEFRREREAGWRRLERLVSSVERGSLDSLSDRERIELPMLYRSALSSLSVARSISLDRALLEYLEALCQRAYFCVYTTRHDLRKTFSDFFVWRFPATVRYFRWHILVAAALLLLGGLAGYLLTLAEPDRFYTFVSPGMAAGRDPGATTEYLRGTLYDREDAKGVLTTFATFLFTHNAKVGMFCFAVGFVAGVPVVIILLINGLMLGAFAGLFASRGLGLDFWGWVLPHGVTELMAVVFCAGAGLVLAHALIFPGPHRRLESLALRGRDAGVLVAGGIAMFFVAGLLEGFFRQLVTDITVRYCVIFATAAFWIVYLGWGGRRRGAR